MKKKNLINLILLLILILSSVTPVYSQIQKFNLQGREYRFENGKWFTFFEGHLGDEIIRERLIVKLNDKGYIENFDFQIFNLEGISLASPRFLDGFYVLSINPEQNPFEIASILDKTGLFEILEFDAIGIRHITPNDPWYNQQWNLAKINMPAAWNITSGSNSIILGIIDSGIKYTHEDIDGNIWVNPAEDRNGNGRPDYYPYHKGGDLDGIDNDGNGYVDDLIGWDFAGGGNNPQPPYSPDNNPDDTDGHGTNVSGVSSAQTNNFEGSSYIGIAGVAGGWGTQKGVSLMVLRDGGATPITSLTAQAIEYAANNGAKVINISSSLENLQVLQTAVNYAVNIKDVLIVASAGNNGGSGDPSIRYPAKYSNTIAVGATDQNDNRRSYSAYGPEMDVVAPDGVPSTTMAGGYTSSVTGTSFSAPHVAGLAALIRSFDPNLTWEQVRYLIRNSADKVSGMGGQNFTNEYGYGRINAYKALQNLYVPQIYSTIQQAFNKAVSGQNIIVSSGAYTVNTNLSVQNGINFIINPGAVLTFNAANKISVWGGGTFTANGATFQGNGTPGYWHSISYFSNSSGSIQNSTIKDAQCGIYTNNASINISNNTITNNSIYGLSILQNSNAPVSNCVISNNGTGINLYSSDITITGNNILNNTNYGINANNVSNNYIYWHSNNLHGNGYAMLLNNASPWIGHSNFSDNAHGVVMTSSLTSFAVVPNLDERMRGYNVIACNTATPNFKADNYSSVYAGYGYDGGYNSIYGSELPDMESRNNSGIYACNNYWGSPYPAIYADGTSWILAWYPLNEDPNPSCYNKSSSSFVNTERIEDDFSNIFWEAISEGRQGNLQRAKELLLLIVNGKYDSKYSPLALLAFYDFITNTSSRDSINTGLNTVLTGVYDRAKSDSLRPFAVRLLARENALSNNLNKMIFFNNEIIDNYQNSVNELTALYDLITYYSVIASDTIKAQTLFARMINNYPEEDLTKFAAINLGYNFENLKKNVSSEENPASYELSNAYPNPFNPSTMISYSLRDEGRVSLKVYDILGSEVATLVNETKPAGTYEIEFNANNLPSGVYIYRMSVGSSGKAGGYTASKKMLLVK